MNSNLTLDVALRFPGITYDAHHGHHHFHYKWMEDEEEEGMMLKDAIAMGTTKTKGGRTPKP